MVIIASLNVHEWSNRSGDCIIDEIIKLIINSNIDTPFQFSFLNN